MSDDIQPGELIVYGAYWCPDCQRAKRFLGEQRVHYHWVDIEDNAEAVALVERVNHGKRIIPTIVFPDESILVEPSNAQLAAKLGLQTRARLPYYDLIVVGAGPAGLTAALYAAREGLDVLVIDRSGLGGQAGTTAWLENFPGFPDGISGAEFADRLARQAQRFGVETLQAQDIVGVRAEGESVYVKTGEGDEYGARAALAATGSTYRRLNVAGEDDLIGAGVHFCATCDGPFYKGQRVAVVGGGNSAGEEALFLTRFADHVTLLVRGPQMSASKTVVDKLAETDRVEVRTNTEIVALKGQTHLEGVEVRNRATGAVETLDPAGLFVFIGLSPNSGWLPSEVERDAAGFVVTGVNLETTLPGLFAAGDVRQGSTKQAASAVGEGATAALMIRDYLRTK